MEYREDNLTSAVNYSLNRRSSLREKGDVVGGKWFGSRVGSVRLGAVQLFPKRRGLRRERRARRWTQVNGFLIVCNDSNVQA